MQRGVGFNKVGGEMLLWRAWLGVDWSGRRGLVVGCAPRERKARGTAVEGTRATRVTERDLADVVRRCQKGTVSGGGWRQRGAAREL
jgi:hypothetical protein